MTAELLPEVLLLRQRTVFVDIGVGATPLIGVVAIATTNGGQRLTATIVTAVLAVVALIVVRAERRHALVIEGSRIGYRSGWGEQVVGWTTLDQVVEVALYRRERHLPRMLTVVLWADRPGQEVWGISGVGRIRDPQRARAHQRAGAVPFAIPVGSLDGASRVTLRRFLSRHPLTEPAAHAVAMWN